MRHSGLGVGRLMRKLFCSLIIPAAPAKPANQFADILTPYRLRLAFALRPRPI
jgi:hypothetical protein